MIFSFFSLASSLQPSAYCTSSFLAFGMPATPEWMFLGILALILFGPKKLPGLAKGFGKFMAELQKAKEEFRREILNIPALPTIKEPEEKRAYQPTPTTTASELPHQHPLSSPEKKELPPLA